MGWGVPPNPASLSSDKVYVILEDRAGALWLGTRDGGLNRLDPATGVFSHYRHDPTDAASLSNDNVFALWEDDDGALWVGTDGGLDRFDPAAGTFTRYRHNPDDPTGLSNDAIRALFADSDGTLWVGTWGGGLDRFDRATGTFSIIGTIRMNRRAWVRIEPPPSWRINPATSGWARGTRGWIASNRPREPSPTLRMIRPTRRA
jgi:ligand-binding sensor domain-containing protein